MSTAWQSAKSAEKEARAARNEKRVALGGAPGVPADEEARAMIVNGFIEPIVKTLPMEYAVELSRLIELSMEGAVG